jgi:hypothetical protein
VAAHLGQEELQRVGCCRQLDVQVESQVVVVGVVGGPQLDAALLQRVRELGEVVLSEVVCLDKRLELARVDVAQLFPRLEQGLDIVLVQNRSDGAAPFLGSWLSGSRCPRGAYPTAQCTERALLTNENAGPARRIPALGSPKARNYDRS